MPKIMLEELNEPGSFNAGLYEIAIDTFLSGPFLIETVEGLESFLNLDENKGEERLATTQSKTGKEIIEKLQSKGYKFKKVDYQL